MVLHLAGRLTVLTPSINVVAAAVSITGARRGTDRGFTANDTDDERGVF
jgi:hypothetical protein